MIDWRQGSWQRTPNSPRPDQRILLAGDWAPIRRYRDVMLSDPLEIYGDLLPRLQRADLRIVNVEVPLSELGVPILKDGPNLQGAPEAVAALAAVPFDVGCLANNHMMDFGPAALRDTQRRLSDVGLLTVGAGLSRNEALAPLVLTSGETQVGILNFCEGEDNTSAREGAGVFGWELETALATVRVLRARVDLVLAIVHAGREYTPAPPPYVRQAYRALAEAGADAVIGHHPHVPQGVEVHAGVPIAYSLGNFAFYQDTTATFRRRGYLFELHLSNGEVSGFSLIPYALEEGGLRRLQGVENQAFLADLRTVSEPLASAEHVAALWDAYLDSRGEAFWREESAGLRPLVAEAGGAPQVAAKLRNRVTTPAHREFIADGLTRLMAGTLGTAPAWAAAIVRRWTGEPG